MVKHILKTAAVVCGIVVLGPMFANAQVPTKKPVLAPPIRPQDVISSMTFTPKLVQLYAGGDPVVVKVTVAFKVYNISLQITKDGQTVSGVSATTSKEWLNSGNISLQADGMAMNAAGNQLKLLAILSNLQKIDAAIPTDKFSIEVIPNTLRLTRIIPSNGERGSVVTVEGNQFLSKPYLGFYFAGPNVDRTPNQMAELLEKTDHSLKVKVPRYAVSGKVSLSLGTNTNAVSLSSEFIFTVDQRPTIEYFYPTGAPPGTVVEVRGYNFTTISSGLPVFKFSNDVTANCGSAGLQVDETDRGPLQKAYVTVPSGAVSGPLKVLTPAGTGISAQKFLVGAQLTSPPVITQFTPAKGIIGTVVTINGQKFGQDAFGVSVRFGSQTLSVTPSSCTNETIQVNVPVNATTGKISVTTSGGSAKSTATFYLPPEITSVYPNSGPVGYQTYVTGKNFDLADKSVHVVKFNGVPAKVVSVGESTGGGTKLTVEVPTGATSGTITVETPGGKATSPQSFTVVQ